MKRLFWIGITAIVTIALAACNADQSSSATSSSTEAATSASADTTQAAQAASNAATTGTPGAGGFRPSPQMQTFNQVSAGIWYLADNQDANTITKDQATKLLAIYQDFQTEMQPVAAAGAGTGTPQTGSAGGGGGNPGGQRGGGFGPMDPAKVQSNLQAIDAILTPDQLAIINKLTQDQITATMQKHGLNFGNRGGNNGTPGPRPTPDPNQLATLQAQGTANPRPQGNPFLLETLKVLQGIAGS